MRWSWSASMAPSVHERVFACVWFLVQCGARNRLSAHHVIPRAEGGGDAPENPVSLCVSCHAHLEAERRRGS
jgi:HNH endonuclease